MSESKSEQVIDKRLGDILDTVESACVTARCVIDRYRIMKPFSENGKKEKIISKVAGEIEVTAEGWLHIKLNTLLPNCRYKTNSYIQDTLTRLLEECSTRHFWRLWNIVIMTTGRYTIKTISRGR